MARREEDENCLIGDHQMQISPSNKFPKESKTVALGVAARRGLKNMDFPIEILAFFGFKPSLIPPPPQVLINTTK